MKNINLALVKSALLFCLCIFFVASSYSQVITNEPFKIKPEDVLASCHSHESTRGFQTVSIDFGTERGRLINELLKIVKDPNSLNLDQCAAIYYLGEIRASEATDVLANKITLKLDYKHLNIDGLLVMPVDFPIEALVKIGIPSIQPLIRNLAESDDAQVRKLSLQVLCRIDCDKDISQLRLQKALKAETDSQKQARLQTALKSLDEFH